ncbi:restriction endonuclease subunit S [Hydrogenophaga aromaticivorans]|uniref:restriction endonuclease subunit S n=1 Tax=Hydrogenophaga aromaticivorans TaxID=2610898 RepID=UPI0015A2AA6C
MTATRIALADFCQIVQGGRHKLSGNDFVEHGFPAYGAGGMNGLLPAFEFEEAAVVLSSIGARCGKCFYVDGKWSSLANTQVIRPDPEKADCRFLWHQLNDESRWPRSGTGQPFIKPSDVKRHLVHLPSLDEQRRIADILDKADTLRTKRRESLVQLDRLTQSIFVEMFGDPVANPKQYPTFPLSALVEPERGITYGIVQRGEDCEEGIPVLRIRDLADEEIDIAKLKRTSPEVSAQYRRTILRGGEIAISIRGTVGRCCIVTSALAGGNVSREIALVPLQSRVSPVFVQQVIRSTSVQRLIADDVKGVAQSGINLEDLRQLRVVQPPAEEIEAFEARAAVVARLLRDVRSGIAKLTQLTTTLQHRAFQGAL